MKKYAAELIGTFALVFIGAGSVVIASVSGNVGLVGVAFAHGFILMAMVYALGSISGCHINPAVTAAMWAARKIDTKEAAGYITFQLMGAAIAGFSLLYLFPTSPVNLGVTDLASSVTLFNGIAIEAVLTFLLVFVVFSARENVGLAIGSTLFVSILFGGSLTGAALNPARAFGPALAANYWNTQLVYWAGPILGGLAAAFVYQGIFAEKKRKR